VRRFRLRHDDDLARELRANRPQLPDDFVQSLARRIDTGGRRTHLYVMSRLSFAAAISVLLLGTLASFGGFSYAAASARGAVKAVKGVVAPARPQVAHHSAAQDQYGPQKVTICHKGHTITISRAALPAHQAHGDTIGPCPPGGVVGAGANRNGGGVLGSSGTSGTLPQTGISLGATVLASLLLMGIGFALRRRASREL
jgi:LPXTG-motif cell wall-anchored protein